MPTLFFLMDTFFILATKTKYYILVRPNTGWNRCSTLCKWWKYKYIYETGNHMQWFQYLSATHKIYISEFHILYEWRCTVMEWSFYCAVSVYVAHLFLFRDFVVEYKLYVMCDVFWWWAFASVIYRAEKKSLFIPTFFITTNRREICEV